MAPDIRGTPVESSEMYETSQPFGTEDSNSKKRTAETVNEEMFSRKKLKMSPTPESTRARGVDNLRRLKEWLERCKRDGKTEEAERVGSMVKIRQALLDNPDSDEVLLEVLKFAGMTEQAEKLESMMKEDQAFSNSLNSDEVLLETLRAQGSTEMAEKLEWTMKKEQAVKDGCLSDEDLLKWLRLYGKTEEAEKQLAMMKRKQSRQERKNQLDRTQATSFDTPVETEQELEAFPEDVEMAL